jgi:hypothetical protein
VETVFALLSVATLPWWLSMLLFPRSPFTVRLVVTPWGVIGLGAVYVALLLGGLLAGGAPASLDAAALAEALSGPWGFLTVWAHLLALDLFAGTWVFRDARYYGRVPRLELLLTWWAGPAGLALYLWRRRSWRGPGGARVIN